MSLKEGGTFASMAYNKLRLEHKKNAKKHPNLSKTTFYTSLFHKNFENSRNKMFHRKLLYWSSLINSISRVVTLKHVQSSKCQNVTFAIQTINFWEFPTKNIWDTSLSVGSRVKMQSVLYTFRPLYWSSKCGYFVQVAAHPNLEKPMI